MKNEKDLKTEYNITFSETCKILKKSGRTISRYIKQGILKPERIRSKRGTLEYRFSKANLLKFKKPERTEKTEQTRPENDIITFLKDQIKVKDETIKELLERDRETNIMINQLQNRLLLTGDIEEDRKERDDKKGQGINGFFKRIFKGLS